jgi:hypothetical protein
MTWKGGWKNSGIIVFGGGCLSGRDPEVARRKDGFSSMLSRFIGNASPWDVYFCLEPDSKAKP